MTGYVRISLMNGFTVHTITRSEFNHGRTRQLGVSLLPDTDVYIFLTQDALLYSNDSLERIVEIFENPQVGCAYGRQLPHTDADPIAAHARLFNYPSVSVKKTKNDIPQLGFKAAFISNSFAAYRRDALLAVGGFPSDVILSEDTFVAARMLLDGWAVQYCAGATVRHSHNYSVAEEFRRYFDVGVFHAREKWILDRFGSPSGEGLRFIKSEIRYLATEAPHLIPLAMVRTLTKLAAYRLGRLERWLPSTLKMRLSMNRRYLEKSKYG